jgi:hypothetical protein
MSKFASTTLSHVKSYSIVQKVTSILFQYQVFQILATYAETYSNKALELLETYPKVIDVLTFADAKANQVLGLADSVVAYPFNKVNSILAKINSIYLARLNQLLPASSTPTLSTNEVSNFITLTKTLYSRSVDFAATHLTSLKSYLTSTYNTEYSKSAGDNEAYKVSYTLVSSTKSVINDVNTKVYKPFKQTTTSYVNDVALQTKNKADSFINEAKSGLKAQIDTRLSNGSTAPENVSVPAPTVSASA